MEKVNIQGVPETMLQTLFARAAHSQKKGHRFYDGKAIEMVQQLDYDFSKAEKDTAMSSGVIARTILLDRMVGDFIRNNPDAVVVNLAAAWTPGLPAGQRTDPLVQPGLARGDPHPPPLFQGAGAHLHNREICHG